MNTAAAVHRHTPTLQAFDARGLLVRELAYLRHPDDPQLTCLVTRHQHDLRGFALRSADPRLHGLGLWNVAWDTDLAGQVLCSRSLDAGVSLVLNDAARRPAWQTSHVRLRDDDSEDFAEAMTRTWTYESPDLRARPLTIGEQVAGDRARIVERFVYATVTPAEQALNLAGQCVQHFDPAGVLMTDAIALAGVVQSSSRFLLDHADDPGSEADWQEGTLPASPAHTSLSDVDATGALLSHTDAAGHRQCLAYDIAGQVHRRWLGVKGSAQAVVADALGYDAVGNLLHETHGNGVRVDYRYEAQTSRLVSIRVERPAAHPLGGALLQDLRHEYDPVGNVTRIIDEAQTPSFWRNQRVLPESLYRYDSLYRLVEASGREMATARWSGGQPSTAPVPLDDVTHTRYTRSYRYDDGGNLTQIRHASPAAANSHTVGITVSDRSNRALPDSLAAHPGEVDALFTAAGAQRSLQPGQALGWTARAELRSVASGGEHYRYDARSQRVLKRGADAGQRVLYLPGLELRTRDDEDLHVIHLLDPGRTQVRLLHWQSGKPDGIDSDQLRYGYTTLTGSCGLELDGHGALISREEYYPFGGTSVWAARNAVEADYKTLRYSGKERDATGLCYFGYRYYQPWVGRWLSADPAGAVDGLNLYAMVGNNPLGFFDADGLMMRSVAWSEPPTFVLAEGLMQFSSLERHQVVEALNMARHTLHKATESTPPDDEMEVWFGPEHRQVTADVMQRWNRLEALVTVYSSPYPGYEKFRRISAPGGDNIAQVPPAFDGSIEIADGFFDASTPFSLRIETMIHELSHLNRVPKVNVVGPGTQDFFYLQDVDPGGDSNRIVGWGLLEGKDVVDQVGLFNEVARFHQLAVVGASTSAMSYTVRQVPYVMSPDESRMQFHANPLLRARVAARNADSVAYGAMAVTARR